MRILNAETLARVLTYPAAIQALEEAYRNPAVVPPRAQMDAGENRLWVMPAAAAGAMGVKVVTQFEGNAARGIDRVQATYLYLDAATGEALALLDGRLLTEIRTAAVSALATKFLANPGPKKLAIFGTGVQARSHLAAMRAVREISEVMVCGSTEEKSRAFAEAHGCRAASAPECCAADLICACTTSRKPLWDGNWLRPGTHINAVGNSRPDTREIDGATVARSRLAVDTLHGALIEAGDLLLPIASETITPAHIVAELSEIVLGKKTVRRTARDITLFKSVGYALGDLALARLAYQAS